MRAGAPTVARRQRDHRLGLAGLILGLALGAVVLYLAAGPPQLPDSLPDWATIQVTLQGSQLPLAAVAYVLTTAAWMLWCWITLSLVLRLILGVADARTGGAVWVRLLRALSDRTTLPVVRRLVDGALVAVVVVNLAGASVPAAAAAPFAALGPATITARPVTSPRPDAVSAQADLPNTSYTVEPGDTLWTIAERFYGTGFAYPKLVDANAGREMPDGGRFTRAGVIQPGWVLEIPSSVDAVVSGREAYLVQPGDTLGSIAARLLGAESRWREIFDLNRGTARLDDGRTLTDPNLIWPGLSLILPQEQPRLTASSPTEPMADLPAATPADGSPSAPPAPEPDGSPAPSSLGSEVPPASPAPTVSELGRLAPSVIEQAVSLAPDVPLPLTYVATLAAAITTVGGATLLARRRSRRRLAEPLLPADAVGPAIRDGFVEVNPAHRLGQPRQTQEAEAVVWVVEQVMEFLQEQGLAGTAVVTVRQGRGGLTLMLRAGRADLDRLPALASEIGSRLGGSGRASVTPDQDLLLQLSGLKPARFPLPPSRRFDDACCLVPLGLLPDRELLSVNWPELGPVLIAGMAGTGPVTILTSLITTLCARYRPDELELLTIASSATLPGALAELPHQVRGFIDPDAREDVGAALAAFREELTRRMRSAVPENAGAPGSQPYRPLQVLVIGELADLVDEAAALDIIGLHGPAHGMYLLAATMRIDGLDEERLAPFTTRLVLQTLNEEQSIRLLGRPDAADLGEGGDALLRVDGRLPVRLRGFRVAGEDLHRLVQVMRAEFGRQMVDEPVDSACTDAISVASGAGLVSDDVQSPPGISELALKSEDVITASAEGPNPDEVREEDAPPGPASQGNGYPQPRVLEAPAAVRAGDVLTVEETVANGHHAGEDLAAASTVHQDAADGKANGLHRPPLIRVRCFGRLRVVSGDRELSPTDAAGGHYKAWELLAYLAVQPEGIVSKEKLFAALWPDADPDRAANRLRSALTRLRAVLAEQVPGLTPDVVRGDRDGSCRLDTRIVQSDVHQFLTLTQPTATLPAADVKARYEQALALYHDDLLTEPLYEWVHERDDDGCSLQERWREISLRVTDELAQRYRRDGAFAEAVSLYKRLLQHEPILEDAVRDLYRCYRQLGDLNALIREDRRLRQALREAYGDPSDPVDDPESYQPEPATVALFEQIRAELETESAERVSANGHRRSGRG